MKIIKLSKHPIVTTKNGVEDENKNMHRCRHSKLSKKNRKTLEKLKHRQDIALANAEVMHKRL